MEPVNQDNKAPESETSYEELNKKYGKLCLEAQQMNEYINKLHVQIQQMNTVNMFKRLDYLFEVLKYESVIKDPEFINYCIQEIKSMMILPEEDASQEEN